MKREIENYKKHIIGIMQLHNPICRDLEGTKQVNPMYIINMDLQQLEKVMNKC
jgi:hypothetical protein